MVGAGIGNGYAMTPKRPQDDGILRVWLQEFAWTEGDEEQCKKAERASSLPPNSLSSVAIEKEPMFCFETALKSLYWSMLVYDHKEVPGSGYCVADALQLYDLKHFELHWDKDPAGLDTKAVVGWSNDTLVIAFRGTASLANVKADVQAWRTPWPRGVGNWFLCTSPMVHWGFLEAWTRNGFCQHILGLVQHMLDSRGSGGADSAPCKPLSVLVTGHSLGGALATLCAFDIASKYPETSIRVRCYTFGAPRTGNHVFARLYNDAVPDTWQLINNDDVVTQAGKFFVLYKRPGFRALINRLGDIVVRPNYVETAIRRLPGATSLRDHLLTSYQAAMASVLGVQFSAKGFATGREGVLSLAQRKGGATVLGMVGLAHDTLHVLQEQGWEGFREMRRRSKQTRQLLRPWPRRKVPGGSHSVEVSLEEGSPDAAQKPGKAAQEPEVEQPAIKAEAEWLRKHASRLALQPTGDLPLELESTMTARGPISLDGASPLDLAAEEQGDRDD